MPVRADTMQMIRQSKFRHMLEYIEDAEIDEDAVSNRQLKQHTKDFTSAPIFSSAAHDYVDTLLHSDNSKLDLIPQYGLIGICKDKTNTSTRPEDRLLFANLNLPWSAFICGSQGAGKSHTLSCLLESSLFQCKDVGQLPNPLAGLVMHYDSFTSHSASQLCEAAYLCSSGIPVTVMVSPSNIWAMKYLYENLPGLGKDSPRPRVVPLYLNENQLDVARILKLMAVDPTADKTPLYMEVVMSIIREIAMSGATFTYTLFCQRLADVRWVQGQQTPLNMRLQLLDSFLAPSTTTKYTKPAVAEGDIWDFEPGTLTIIDLSDPFMSSDNACCLFSICLSIFLEERGKCGRVVAMDEAHKFLLQSGDARVLTGELTSIIRQQRHTGTRVFIATQEPTLSPELIDLANVTFVHRFLSPAWYNTLKEHLAGASRQDIFEKIVKLRTGEAIMFCPTALIGISEADMGCNSMDVLGNRFLNVKIRKRTTIDGGKSIMANDSQNTDCVTKLVVESVRMHVVTATNATRFSKGNPEPSQLSLRDSTTRKEIQVEVATDSKDMTGMALLNLENIKGGVGKKPQNLGVTAIHKANKESTAGCTTLDMGKGKVAAHVRGNNVSPKDNSTYTIIETKTQLHAAIQRHTSLVAQNSSFSRTADLTGAKRKKLYSRFKKTVQIPPGLMTETELKSTLFSSLDTALAKKQITKRHAIAESKG